MILSIGSSIESFKDLNFHPGLNVLLADTKDVKKSGKTRNSAGKTSFVLIVDFLLGANCEKKSLFRSHRLNDEFFRGEFIIDSKKFAVERSGSAPSKIFILAGSEFLETYIQIEDGSERIYVSTTDWKQFLGTAYFGLSKGDAVDPRFSRKYKPTTRAMLKYFLRLASDGGFDNPHKSSKSQQKSSWQTCFSYMLGLEWRISQEFQDVRDKEKLIKSLKAASGDNSLVNEYIGTVADLRPKVVLAHQRTESKRSEISNFQVLDSYSELTNEAASHQHDMQETSKRLVSLKETLAYLTDSFEAEKSTYSVSIEDIYEASGIELPGLALRRFEDVKEFENSILENRKIHLKSEIESTTRNIEDAQQALSKSGNLRQLALSSLKGKGAFADLVELQKELAKLEAGHAILAERFDAAEAMERENSELKVNRIELQRRLQADHKTHSDILDSLIVRIAELIAALYDNREGRFIVSDTENGPEFSIKIEGDRGTGIKSMEVFCMDIALFEVVKDRFGGPGFLIHDSHLFDGVDARQIFTAIEIGQSATEDNGQYIVTLNSDIYESLMFPEKYDRESAVLDTRLSDDGDKGGLFGFRFD